MKNKPTKLFRTPHDTRTRAPKNRQATSGMPRNMLSFLNAALSGYSRRLCRLHLVSGRVPPSFGNLTLTFSTSLHAWPAGHSHITASVCWNMCIVTLRGTHPVFESDIAP